MCLESKNLKIKTAKRDIPIWKIVEFDNKRQVYISPFKYYQYVPDITKYHANDFLEYLTILMK